jgi:NAD(P)H-dependent FMN reductase
MLRVAIVTASPRPGRTNQAVARWVYELASRRADAEFEMVDLAADCLPRHNKPLPSNRVQSARKPTRRCAEKMGSFDAYVVVTPEFNHSAGAALNNALGCRYREWANRATGLVSYSGASDGRLVESQQAVICAPQVANSPARVMLSALIDCENSTRFEPDPQHEKSVHALLDEVIASGGALKAIRALLRWGA